MSLLSQFFPSGGGGFSIAQKIEILMVAGGGGAGSSGGICVAAPRSALCGAIVGGGGGGGQVVFSDGYEVIQDVSYPVTIGAGGAGGGFYYDTTNVYYPRHNIQPNLAPTCYCPQLSNRNAGTLRGANGGNTIFGSVVAYGGGGGGGGTSSTSNYLPNVCQTGAMSACTEWTALGGDNGSGGGSGSGWWTTSCTCGVQTESPWADVRPGKAIYNDSISFLKYGSNGTKFSVPSKWSAVDSSTNFTSAGGFSVLSFATGGGGNNTSTGQPAAGLGICLKTPTASVACMVFNNFPCFTKDARSGCPGGAGFYSYTCSLANGAAAVNAFMEGTIGDGGSYTNEYAGCNDFLANLRGGDGHETNITPSPEYYGGGGGVTYGMVSTNCTVLAGAVMSPGSPCYPLTTWQGSPCYAWFTCPYGGKGGGGFISTPLITCTPNTGCFYCIMACTQSGGFTGCRTVGWCCQCGTMPIPGCICPGSGTSGCGGGGASFHGGCGFTSTGSVFDPASTASTCAYCGFAGGSGAVIIRYPTVFSAATVTGNTPITAQSGYRVYKWTSPGSITFPS